MAADSGFSGDDVDLLELTKRTVAVGLAVGAVLGTVLGLRDRQRNKEAAARRLAAEGQAAVRPAPREAPSHDDSPEGDRRPSGGYGVPAPSTRDPFREEQIRKRQQGQEQAEINRRNLLTPGKNPPFPSGSPNH